MVCKRVVSSVTSPSEPLLSPIWFVLPHSSRDPCYKYFTGAVCGQTAATVHCSGVLHTTPRWRRGQLRSRGVGCKCSRVVEDLKVCSKWCPLSRIICHILHILFVQLMSEIRQICGATCCSQTYAELYWDLVWAVNSTNLQLPLPTSNVTSIKQESFSYRGTNRHGRGSRVTQNENISNEWWWVPWCHKACVRSSLHYVYQFLF